MTQSEMFSRLIKTDFGNATWILSMSQNARSDINSAEGDLASKQNDIMQTTMRK